MRVLMIAQSSYDYDSRIIRLSAVLVEKNIDVDLICLRYNNQSKFEVINGVHIYRIMKNFNQDSIFSYIFYSLIFLFRSFLKSILISTKNKHDLVHVHNMPDYLVFATAYHKIKGIPIILDIHDLTVELFKEKWSLRKFNLFKGILKSVEKLSCKFADHLITVTKECVDILVYRGNKEDKISLIMNSPDEKVFTYDFTRFNEPRSKKNRFLYHGTIAKRFGLHNFIKAMPKILESIPNAEFHIYGKSNNEYSSSLKRMINNMRLNNIFFIDHIPYTQLSLMIKEFDMGVITYEQTEYMNLAIPTKAGEYALSGLPFIISDLNSVRSVFREQSVCYVNPSDPDNIAEKIVELWYNNKLREKMAESAYEDVKKISWYAMKDKYIRLINYLTQN